MYDSIRIEDEVMKDSYAVLAKEARPVKIPKHYLKTVPQCW